MSNARPYGHCDAQGRIVRASVPESFPLQTMRAVRYSVLDETLEIEAALSNNVLTAQLAFRRALTSWSDLAFDQASA